MNDKDAARIERAITGKYVDQPTAAKIVQAMHSNLAHVLRGFDPSKELLPWLASWAVMEAKRVRDAQRLLSRYAA